MMTRNEALTAYGRLTSQGHSAADAYIELMGMSHASWKMFLLRVPARMHPHIVEWVLFGHIEDDFLMAVVSGELFEAAARADDENQRLLYEYAYVMHNAVPSESKGPNALKTWKGIWPEEPAPAPEAA